MNRWKLLSCILIVLLALSWGFAFLEHRELRALRAQYDELQARYDELRSCYERATLEGNHTLLILAYECYGLAMRDMEIAVTLAGIQHALDILGVPGRQSQELAREFVNETLGQLEKMSRVLGKVRAAEYSDEVGRLARDIHELQLLARQAQAILAKPRLTRSDLDALASIAKRFESYNDEIYNNTVRAAS